MKPIFLQVFSPAIPTSNAFLNVEYLDYFPMRKEYALNPTREDKDDGYFGRI
ncbi:MAG: hypothetical protein U0T82_01750 [Bacteroidales bacterium]